MTTAHELVFLLDVDNTLLDNDQIVVELRHHLEHEFGPASANRYWAIFEDLRRDLGYADYLGALQLYRFDAEHHGRDDSRMLQMSDFLIDYPFADRLYPGALEVISHLNSLGCTVILTDGDVVFQPRKIQRSGLWDSVDGRVLLFVHKEKMLDSVQRHFPARHYVMVDDKLRILTAMKAILQEKLTTIFPRQGHYALDLENVATYPSADISVDHIEALKDFKLPRFTGQGGAGPIE